ncbi:OsmC family protein [Candidatus Aciduliprofundum boonei]|uniref:OsmC family protein n=1 Tax=Aciduliprofundum boonei (strain DSM 19572 / T469) TaxID=439481 RepID=B5IEP9_ACIB4|nr:OsmC family protein [Candidatus Aciduliprofundum boonei]ADD07923.1 OsmC family protein [Aciduliprofundum boonei T469]EDY35218.1 OsmC-like protein [Aciduliprofundum boonei T469]HII55575.1 OsmC family protein [Candidatus Aciduliprofundum boonei]
MRVRVHDDLLITAEDESTALLLSGNGKAMSPMKALLASLGGCTGIDVLMILKKMREDVKEVNVYIDYERAKEYPKIYTKINLKYVVIGNVKKESVERAIKLSEEKYCSVSAMLSKTTEINRSYEIVEG